MNTTNLSNHQLYGIIQNLKLHESIRQAANDEFNKRKLSSYEIERMIELHDSQFVAEKEDGLKLTYKLLLMACPFFIEIHSLIAGRMLEKGHKNKWKDYWLYISLGYLIWTVVIVLLAKYYLFKPQLNKA
ncbi:MAG: hypothetical protein EAY75_13850 [Bacteroidetes bacterium]|nr:MAG: hypothetical protein EAY75_13850 [Bacteroidota bacterium]